MFVNLKIINDEFSKVARSNIKIQKSVSFFILTLTYQKGSQKTVLFKIALKNKIFRNKPDPKVERLTY